MLKKPPNSFPLKPLVVDNKVRNVYCSLNRKSFRTSTLISSEDVPRFWSNAFKTHEISHWPHAKYKTLSIFKLVKSDLDGFQIFTALLHACRLTLKQIMLFSVGAFAILDASYLFLGSRTPCGFVCRRI